MSDRGDHTLSEQGFLILLALSSGAMHGYALLGAVERLSDGRISMSTGTLYGAIRRFLESGWIRRSEDPEPETASRDRQAYELTREGRRLLESELSRLEQLAKTARATLATVPARGRR